MTEAREKDFGGKIRLAVWKFASCDGCQLSLLNLEDELMQLADRVELAYFLEASSDPVDGPYDLSLVEGSITTEHDAGRIQEIRRQSRVLVTIGACATSGGIQALRNKTSVQHFAAIVYPRPEWIETLKTSTPIKEHVRVDGELHGCPISKEQLVEFLTSLLAGKQPFLPDESVCMECKRSGVSCVLISQGEACLGPVTRAGCGALCPRHHRGCFGCFGPKEHAQTEILAHELLRRANASGTVSEESRRELVRLFSSFQVGCSEFRAGVEAAQKSFPIRPEDSHV